MHERSCFSINHSDYPFQEGIGGEADGEGRVTEDLRDESQKQDNTLKN